MSGPATALPPALTAALDALLERRDRAALQDSARRLSDSYRARKPTSAAIRSETDALAYALTRMPATYAATIATFGRLRREQPAFAPRGLLDLGCGLAAAAYAAAEVWPALERVTLLDRSREFLLLARALADQSGHPALAGARVLDADLTRLPRDADAPYDLVVASYALTELADAELLDVADAIWTRTGEALVIVEPGTPRDYRRLMTVRDRLLQMGATLLAPCPHAAPCPLLAPDWCHFPVRLPRTRTHKLLKDAQAPFEDEKFSFLALARHGGPAVAARVIAPPRAGKAGVALKLCAANGICETFVPKRDKPRYERIRRLAWGDGTEAPAEEH